MLFDEIDKRIGKNAWKKSFKLKTFTFEKFDQIKRTTIYFWGNLKGVKVLGSCPRSARLEKEIDVPAPVLPPIPTCWLPNSLWLVWPELTLEVVVEVVTLLPVLLEDPPPISFIKKK